MIRLIEPLNTEAPPDARPYCSIFDITFYDKCGNNVLDKVNAHEMAEGAAPGLFLIDGEWWEVGGGEVRYREGEWVVIRRGYRNTRAAIMANVGWHYHRSAVRPGRWPWVMWDRLCCHLHRAFRSLIRSHA